LPTAAAEIEIVTIAASKHRGVGFVGPRDATNGEAPMVPSVDDQIKEIDLQLKKISLNLKQKELNDQDGWSNKLKSPAVVAAMITAMVLLSSAIVSATVGWKTSSDQASTERQKNQNTILLAILQEYDTNATPGRNAETRAERIKIGIQSRLISDDDGSICMAFIGSGCPIKVITP
jgi:hypothetical protein